MHNKAIDRRIQGLNILIVDGNSYMRRLTRMMLMNLGAKSVMEASDGLAALEAIRTGDPDVMFLDWDMPVLNGMEALRTGVHEFLLKPTSPKALHDRLMSILVKPRRMLRLGDFYVPEPRRIPLGRELGSTRH